MDCFCRSLLMTRRFTILFFLTASLHAAPVFIGTNTGKNSTSKGIYLADFDSATSNLSEPALAAVALVVLGLFR